MLGIMFQLRVLRSPPHRQKLDWSPKSGTSWKSGEASGVTLSCKHTHTHTKHHMRTACLHICCRTITLGFLNAEEEEVTGEETAPVSV